MEKKDRLKFLLERFHEGMANAAELAELEQLLNDPGATVLIDELWDTTPAGARFFDEGRTEAMLVSISARNREAVQMRRRTRQKRMLLSIAATVILLSTLTVLYVNTPIKKPARVAERKKMIQPVLPGSDKAILVLADGSTIYLDSAENGTIPVQGTTHVSKINGQVVYASSGAGTDAANLLYNTLKTPRGGQYQLQLADGSKVWMNAGSSLYFPTSFPGKERVVQLTGEAYFEIARDAQRPFRVQVNDMHVNVLGTHFNVMAYDNEAAASITLLEGAVRVERNNDHINMRPGQQVQSGNDTRLRLLNNIDLEEAVAWKNGYLQSNHTSLAVLMRQIERWYNVDVVYEGKIPDRKFGGKIPRKSELKQVLKALELSKVYTKVEGNKIVVMDR
ncbi:MAG TPA: FecR domain-containing protein [Niastella sp.]